VLLAQIWADYRRYIRDFGAELDIKEFYDLFSRRKGDSKVKIPKAMEAAFAEPTSDLERQIKSLIDEFSAEQEFKLQQELFKQRKRLGGRGARPSDEDNKEGRGRPAHLDFENQMGDGQAVRPTPHRTR
jgi:hypothetical protein